jgi:hypothetical protein
MLVMLQTWLLYTYSKTDASNGNTQCFSYKKPRMVLLIMPVAGFSQNYQLFREILPCTGFGIISHNLCNKESR